MTLVLERPPGDGKAATHALVIGVGHYADLPDDFAASEHKTLSSPPISARVFADWLAESFNNPDKPLRSIEMLLSEKGQAKYGPPGARKKNVESATLANVTSAFGDWKTRCNSSASNQALFFFCGHGVAAGSEQSLLLGDCGSNPDDPLVNAIDLNRFSLGMNQVKARQQMYFIDACRVCPPSLIDSGSTMGQALIRPRRSQGQPRLASILMSTLAGASAYGIPNEASIFTKALIRSMKGAGSTRSRDHWIVKPSALLESLEFFTRIEAREYGVDDLAPGSAKELSNFPFHYIEGEPDVPVEIYCVPDGATCAADLSYSCGANQQARPQRSDKPWVAESKPGDHTFFAKFPEGKYADGSIGSYVYPPSTDAAIQVKEK